MVVNLAQIKHAQLRLLDPTSRGLYALQYVASYLIEYIRKCNADGLNSTIWLTGRFLRVQSPEKATIDGLSHIHRRIPTLRYSS